MTTSNPSVESEIHGVQTLRNNALMQRSDVANKSGVAFRFALSLTVTFIAGQVILHSHDLHMSSMLTPSQQSLLGTHVPNVVNPIITTVFNESTVEIILNRIKRAPEEEWGKGGMGDGRSIGLSMIREFLPKVNRRVQSFHDKKLELYDGWMRIYRGESGREGGAQRDLSVHTDHCNDELSAIIQYTAGSYLFVLPKVADGRSQMSLDEFSESQARRDPMEEDLRNITLPVLKMNAGDMAIFEGRSHPHGCRKLKPEEVRITTALFYQVSDSPCHTPRSAEVETIWPLPA